MGHIAHNLNKLADLLKMDCVVVRWQERAAALASRGAGEGALTAETPRSIRRLS
jgi:hypothetical protein